uniref:thioredoxin-dependent peroxiredoxin n=1 Tax=Sus scrofa TaxID=9823 RepID=A0A8D0P641_PIG
AKGRAAALAWSWRRRRRRRPRRLWPLAGAESYCCCRCCCSCCGLKRCGAWRRRRGPEPARRSATSTRVDKCTPGRHPGFRSPITPCTSAKPRVGDALPRRVSKPAPYWEGTAVINGEFKELKLTDYRGKYLVFFFYPLDFTFVCPTEIIAFGDRIEEFRSINTEVVACSVDSQFTHLAWINTPRRQGGLGPIRIPLLSDLNHQISKDYGVYLEDSGHTLRGLFIIDDKGILRQITLNDLPVGRSVDETLRLVQAFQYTDKHGEVCPAGWKPGSETVSQVDFSIKGVAGAPQKSANPRIIFPRNRIVLIL